jgi:hypothetical protein
LGGSRVHGDEVRRTGEVVNDPDRRMRTKQLRFNASVHHVSPVNDDDRNLSVIAARAGYSLNFR